MIFINLITTIVWSCYNVLDI